MKNLLALALALGVIFTPVVKWVEVPGVTVIQSLFMETDSTHDQPDLVEVESSGLRHSKRLLSEQFQVTRPTVKWVKGFCSELGELIAIALV